MPNYAYRAVNRSPDGVLGETLYEEPIQAPDATAAIAIARTKDPDIAALGANAVYLSDAEGRVLWSLHVAPPAAGGGEG